MSVASAATTFSKMSVTRMDKDVNSDGNNDGVSLEREDVIVHGVGRLLVEGTDRKHETGKKMRSHGELEVVDEMDITPIRKKVCSTCCKTQCICQNSSNDATPQNIKPQHYVKADGSPLDRPNDAPWPFTILFVGVDNGEKTDPDLNLKREFEKIEQAYRESEVSKHGSSRVIIKQLFFSKWNQVIEEIIKEAPTMLQFGCHSQKGTGLELFRQIVDPHDMLDAIRSWNESAREQRPPRPEIRIIVVNACDSEGHARVLSEGIDFAIGHYAPVADENAINFSGIFYAGLFRCTSLMGSFNMAKSCSKGYRLFSPKKDPRQFYLVSPGMRLGKTSASSQHDAGKGSSSGVKRQIPDEASAQESEQALHVSSEGATCEGATGSIGAATNTGHAEKKCVVRQQATDARSCRVFLSYRVASDADLVERLYYRLRAESVDVWWDKLCLPAGQPWEQGFADGLCSSDIFVSVLSKTALAPFAQLTAASACDNVLLEQQLALELHKRGDLRAIYPVLVGELNHLSDQDGDLYSDFFKTGGVPACPDEVVKAVEDKVAEHLKRLGKGALSTARTVKATLNAITQFQGVKLWGTCAIATDIVVAKIAKVYRQYSSCDSRQQVLDRSPRSEGEKLHDDEGGSRDLPNLQQSGVDTRQGPTELGPRQGPTMQQCPINIALDRLGDFTLSAAEERPEDVSQGATSQYEIVAFLKKRGLVRIAERVGEDLGLEEIDDLKRVELEEIDLLEWLKPQQKKKLLELVREVTARLMSADDNELSADDTISQGDSTPLARSLLSPDTTDFESDSEDVLVAARNGGNSADFQVHMTGLIRSFFECFRLEDADPEWETFDWGSEGSSWTLCMLLWIRFAHDATLDRRLCDEWRHVTTNSPSQDQLLSILTECLESPGTSHPRWSPAESCECRKEHASGISFTDEMVEHALRGNENAKQKWRENVVQDWLHTDEPASAFLSRANKFLRDPEHSIKGMRIFESLVETQSYVVFLKMPGLVASLLFGYLEARKLDFAFAAGAARGGRTLLHGFTSAVSSEGHAFSVTVMPALHVIVQGLQCLSHHAHTCWELMDPVKDAQVFLAPADYIDFWEPFLAIKPKPLLSFVSLSRCRAVSRGWRDSVKKNLRTLPILSFGKGGVMDADVLRSLNSVASENLREVDLSGCRKIGASGMENILRKCAETCLGLLEVNITACSEEAILRAVAIRARAVCNADSALELYQKLPQKLEELASRDQPSAMEPRLDAAFDANKQSATKTGVIFNTSKLKTNGFGFIKPDTGGPNVFFHRHGKGNKNVTGLSHGQAVKYTHGVNAKGICAENIVPAKWEKTDDTSSLPGNPIGVNETAPAHGKERYAMSNLRGLLNSTRPLLVLDDDVQFAPDENALFRAVARGSDVDVALLLTVSFSVGGAVRVYGVEKEDSKGNAALLTACRAGNWEVAKFLVAAGAKVNSANNQDDTPLHLACGGGKLELAEMLVGEGAQVNSANHQGNTPLLAAVGAGNLELAEMLVIKGANVKAVREDCAGLLSLAIVSQQPEMLKFALTRGPEMLPHQDRMSHCDFTKAFVESYFDPVRIEGWLRTGASPLGLAGQVGALMASCALESSTKNRLEDVRAFLFHYLDMLQEPSKWPVKHAVQQLALQEAGTVCGDKYGDRDKAAGESRCITLINKREKHLCRSIHRVQSPVRAVCYSPDGSKLARVEGCEVVVCDASTGFVQKTLCGHSAEIWSVAFSADGTVIASGSNDRTVRLWDAETGSCKCTLTVDSSVECVAFSPDGSKIAAAHSNKIQIFDAHTQAKLGSPLNGHSRTVSSVCFSPDGKQVASGSWDRTVKVWQTSTGTCQSTLTVHSGVSSVAFSPDGSKIAAAYWHNIQILDAQTKEKLGSPLSGHSDLVRCVCFSPDGSKLASCSNDRSVKIWNLITRECVSTLRGDTWINCVAFSPDGIILAAGDGDQTFSQAGSVRLYDTVTGDVKSTQNGHDDPVRSVCFSPCGTKIVSGGGEMKRYGGNEDFSIRIWDAETGTQIGSPLNGHTRSVTKLEYLDEKTLVSGSADGTMRVWSVDNGTPKGELDGGSFAFSKDSSLEEKYSITFKENLLLISEGQSVVAFFRAPHVISCAGRAGERIGVGCKNGEVLQLRAPWLV